MFGEINGEWVACFYPAILFSCIDKKYIEI